MKIKFKDLCNKPKIIAIVGDVNTGKSNLLYHIIEDLKKFGNFSLYTYGLRLNVKSKQIYSVNELEQIKNSIIILDEVMSLWDLDNRMAKKQIENSLRLINHNNNILIICMLPENAKKFIAGKLDQVIFKKVTFSDFINGSRTKQVCMNYKGAEKGSAVLNINVN